MTDITAGDLLKAGQLSDALTAAQNAVRKAPTDLSARILLAEILVFTGNLEGADVLLDAASTIDPTTGLVVAEFRQLIRADMARRQLFRDGRVPELLSDPTELQRLRLGGLGGGGRGGWGGRAGGAPPRAPPPTNRKEEKTAPPPPRKEARPRAPGLHN